MTLGEGHAHVIQMDYQCVVIYTIVNISAEDSPYYSLDQSVNDSRQRNGCWVCVVSRLKRYVDLFFLYGKVFLTFRCKRGVSIGVFTVDSRRDIYAVLSLLSTTHDID